MQRKGGPNLFFVSKHSNEYENLTMILEMSRMFGFRKKYCYLCGIEVKTDEYKRFGKSFCSEEHAEQYTKEMKKAREIQIAKEETRRSHRGCC